MVIALVDGSVVCSNWTYETGYLGRCVTYVLRDPRNQEVRYVGASIREQSRRQGHSSISLRSSAPVDVWKRRLRSRGLKPVFEVIEEFNCERSALMAERRWIEFFAGLYGPRLLNRQHHPMFKLSGYGPTRRVNFVGR